MSEVCVQCPDNSGSAPSVRKSAIILSWTEEKVFRPSSRYSRFEPYPRRGSRTSRRVYSETRPRPSCSLKRKAAWSEADKYELERISSSEFVSFDSADSLKSETSEYSSVVQSESRFSSSSSYVSDTAGKPLPEYITELASHPRLALYDFGELLGNGSFGDVIAAIRKEDNLPVAIKFVKKKFVREFKTVNGKKIPAEAYFQQRARHRYVIDLYDVFPTEERYVFVMERPQICNDMFNILQGLGTFTEDEARRYFTQIVEANLHCEEQSLIHRDLKPENVLVDLMTGQAKLIDFGLASDVQEKPFDSFRGTRSYTPPEFLTTGVYDGRQGTVWQMGIFLVELLGAESAFAKPEDALKMPPKIPSYISPEAKNLITSLLNTSPVNRPTLTQVLQHPWINMSPF